jgi:GNAT superfamily N-acetyltransferase
MMDYSQVAITRLDEKTIHLADGFACDDPDLEEFLKKDALVYYAGKLAVTYLVIYGGKPVGFFCLSNDSIKVNKEDRERLDELGKHLPIYPAMKIGRLGICREFRSRGLGTLIIEHVMGRALVQSLDVGCRYLTVDSYKKQENIRFYSKNRFKELTDERERKNVPMYRDILKIRG